MDRIPEAIHPRNLVREELCNGADASDADDRGIGEHVERMQLVRKCDPSELHRDTDGESDQVEAPTRELADGGRERDQLDGRHRLIRSRLPAYRRSCAPRGRVRPEAWR